MNLNIFHISTLVFVILKLTNTIDWSWVTVFAPSIFDITLGVLLAVTMLFLKRK